MIAVNGAQKRISNAFSLHDLTLHVDPGEVLCFLGPNGAGKTSLLRLMAGIYQPDAGSVWIRGKDIRINPSEARRNVGVVTDRPRLYPWMRVSEYLQYCVEFYGTPAIRWRPYARDLLERLSLDKVEDLKVTELSNGMQQKLGFVRALLHFPTILMLDEPTLGLDPRSVKSIRSLLEHFVTSGNAVILFTHDLDLALAVSHKLAFLHRGTIKRIASVDSLEARYRLNITSPGNFDEALLREALRDETRSLSVFQLGNKTTEIIYQSRPSEPIQMAIVLLL